MEVRVRLRQLIEARGIKQNVIAARCGQSEQWLSKRLSDRHLAEIKADELPLLAAALGLPVGAFFEDAPAARPSPGQPDLGGRFAAHLDADPLSAAEEAAVEEVTAATKAAIAGYRRSLFRLIKGDEEEQGSA